MATLICHTEGCGNAEHPISLDMTYQGEDGETLTVDAAVCGACGQEITDIS